jgi:hypothetical protein
MKATRQDALTYLRERGMSQLTAEMFMGVLEEEVRAKIMARPWWKMVPLWLNAQEMKDAWSRTCERMLEVLGG